MANGGKKEGEKNRVQVIGYLRVSTIEQDMDNQRLEIMEYARQNSLVVNDFIGIQISSHKDNKSRRIDELLERLKTGDTLIVAELSRLGRSVGQVVTMVDELISRKVKLIAIKENIKLEANGKKDVQTTVMITMFSLFAEMERTLISERTKVGLEAARAKGKLLGRPKGPGKSKLDKNKDAIIALLKNGSRQNYIAERYGTTPANLFNWLKKHNIDTTPVIPQ